MKKGPLSKKEKDFIKDNLVNFKDDMNGLASKLNRSESVVEKFAKTISDNTETIKDTSESVSNLYAKNEERGVTVMTEAASMASDERKKKRKSQNPQRYTQYIHKIKE